MDPESPARGTVGSVLKRFMDFHRLSVEEVAAESGISLRSMTRLRALATTAYKPRSATLRRVADALGALTQVDSEEIYADLMRASGQEARLAQGDLGIRGAAELVSYYQRMSSVGRHILLEQARLLAHELPAES